VETRAPVKNSPVASGDVESPRATSACNAPRMPRRIACSASVAALVMRRVGEFSALSVKEVWRTRVGAGVA
jgi:hypothetical protein